MSFFVPIPKLTKKEKPLFEGYYQQQLIDAQTEINKLRYERDQALMDVQNLHSYIASLSQQQIAGLQNQYSNPTQIYQSSFRISGASGGFPVVFPHEDIPSKQVKKENSKVKVLQEILRSKLK